MEVRVLFRRVIEGESMVVEGRRLTPLVRMIGCNWRRAVVRRRSLGGFGVVAGWLQPTAVWEETSQGRRIVPVRDETLRRTIALLVIAALVPLISNVLVYLASRRRAQSPER
jgi:hypothetical protein